MSKLLAVAVGAVLVLLLLVFSTTYTVNFHQVAIQRTFGESDAGDVITTPGLQWKLPIFQDKAIYDTRLQVLESTLQEISLADGQQVVVKAFLLWKIDTDDPERTLRFDQSYESLDDARNGLMDPFETAVTGAMGAYEFDDLLGKSNHLEDVESSIVSNLSGLEEKGIVPVQVGISQLILPDRASNAVIRRMEGSRKAAAEAKRREGNARAEGIRSKARTVADTIRTFANLRAADIRSEAETQAADYLRQMGEQEDLAIFLVWLDTLEASLSERSTFILDPDSDPWHLMDLQTPTNAQGIPLPPPRGAEKANE